MKNASGAVLSLLSTGQALKWDLYKFTLAGGTATMYCHDADRDITIGGQAWVGGLIFKRGTWKQSNDAAVQTFSLDVSPQEDYPAGPPTVSGFQFLAAVKQGLMDGGTVQWSKLFLPIPTPANYLSWPDLVTYAPVTWGTGIITDSKVGRSVAKLSVSSIHELLNVQMPRNMVNPGCSHVLFDKGCDPAGTLKTANTFSGTVGATSGVLSFYTNLTNATGQFDLGRVVITSGVNSGVSRTVRSYVLGSGNVVTIFMPFNTPCAPGDTFTIYSGCDKQQATCSTKFNNLLHFRGYPYVPEPETLYDGSSSSSQPSSGRLYPLVNGTGSGGKRYTPYNP